MDVGGLLREFFHILMSNIASNHHLFAGDEANRVPRHNIMELEKRSYFYVGVVLAMSIVHGGPAPSFFTAAVADFLLYGIDKTYPTVKDVPDTEVRVKLEKVHVSSLPIRMWNIGMA